MQPRPRFAVAHFADAGAASQLKAALLRQGVTVVLEPDPAMPQQQCLRVSLPAETERMLLELLLASEATRVDVHDDTDEMPRH